MESSVSPFLMFDGKAEEALGFYVSVIPRSSIVAIEHWGTEPPGTEGKVKLARAIIGGLPILAHDSPIHHHFSFTPAMSLFITCASAAEIERVAAALREGGQILMPLDSYGFSAKFTWVNDRFGVSWQLNLP